MEVLLDICSQELVSATKEHPTAHCSMQRLAYTTPPLCTWPWPYSETAEGIPRLPNAAIAG